MRVVNQVLPLTLLIFEASHTCQTEERPAHNSPSAGEMNKHRGGLPCRKQNP